MKSNITNAKKTVFRKKPLLIEKDSKFQPNPEKIIALSLYKNISKQTKANKFSNCVHVKRSQEQTKLYLPKQLTVNKCHCSTSAK